MVTLKEIIRSVSQTVRQATAKTTGQSTLDIIDIFLDEHPSLLVTNATHSSNTSTPIINTTPSSLLSAAANSVATNLGNASSANNTPTSSSSGVNSANNTSGSNSNSNSGTNNNISSINSNSTNTASLTAEDIEANATIDKLSSELFFIYSTTILSSTLAATAISCTPEAQRLHNQQYLLLSFVHALLPLLGPSRIFQMPWWTRALQPILTTAAYTDKIKQQARQIVITSLILEQQIIRLKQQPTSPTFATWTLDYYLEWARAYQDREQHQLELMVDKQQRKDHQDSEEQEQQQQQQQQQQQSGNDIRLQHQALLDMEQEEWSKNLMLILMALGAAETKPFFCLLNGYFQSSQHRLQIVYLLSQFMLRKRTHAHEILETPLFESMLKSLMYDNSTTLIAISVTNMIMLLPRICTSLPPFLPQLFYIFARAISWDQLRDMRKKQHSSSSKRKVDTGWDCADYTFSKLAAPPSNPQTGPFFTALYGLYPCNFLNFLHKPYAYFEKNGFTVPEEFDEETFRTRAMVQVARHMLHPNLVTMDLETELTDRSRWMKMEPPDVIARIMSLDLTNAASRVAFVNTTTTSITTTSTFGGSRDLQGDGMAYDFSNKPRHTNSMDLLDTSLWTATTGAATQSDKEDLELSGIHHSPPTVQLPPTKQQPLHTSPLSNTLEPTRPPTISNILQLHRALKSGSEVLIGDDIWDASLEHMTSPISSACTSPRVKDQSTTSFLDYHQTTHTARGGGTDPTHGSSSLLSSSSSSSSSSTCSSETKLLIAALKREVLLLRNELNFELFLKQQHLQHIGRLHREHVMDSTVEAERQQLYNTNRMLKAQLSQTTASLEKLKSEAVLTRQKHIKWEDEQSNKLRGYREARKEWQAHMEVANTKIEDSQRMIQDLHEQLDEYRKKAFNMENEIQTLQPTLEKATEYQNRVKQLTQQMLLWEEDTTHLKEQKRYIKGLLSQWWSMEELVASLQAENQKLLSDQSHSAKEMEKLAKQLTTLSASPTPQQQSPPQEQQSLFTKFKDTRKTEMDQMKMVLQDLKQQLTQSEMEKIKYLAELEQYKAKHQQQQQPSPDDDHDST